MWEARSLLERFRGYRGERSKRGFVRGVDEMLEYNLDQYASGGIEPRIRYIVENAGIAEESEAGEIGEITPMQVLARLLEAECKPFFDPISKNHTDLEREILEKYGQGLIRVTDALRSYDELKAKGVPSDLSYEEEKMALANLKLGDYLIQKTGARMRLMEVGMHSHLANSIETDLLSPERAISNGLFLPGQETPGATLKGAYFGVRLARHAYPLAAQLVNESVSPWNNNPGLKAL